MSERNPLCDAKWLDTLLECTDGALQGFERDTGHGYRAALELIRAWLPVVRAVAKWMETEGDEFAEMAAIENVIVAHNALPPEMRPGGGE